MSAPSTTTQETVTANPAVRNTDIWTLLGLAILGVRLVQGWVYWGGCQSTAYLLCGQAGPQF